MLRPPNQMKRTRSHCSHKWFLCLYWSIWSSLQIESLHLTYCLGSSPLPRPHWLPSQGRLLWWSVLLIVVIIVKVSLKMWICLHLLFIKTRVESYWFIVGSSNWRKVIDDWYAIFFEPFCVMFCWQYFFCRDASVTRGGGEAGWSSQL